MDAESQLGIWSIVPPIVAVALAFITREAILALLAACIAGLYIAGDGLWGLPALFQRALGTPDFIWVVLVEVCIGILVAFFLTTASTQRFGELAGRHLRSARHIQVFGWLLGTIIFFSDYFSPLLTGPVMRPLTDRARVSREKLAYICDSTSAPVCVLVPLSAWGVFISGLLVEYGPIADNTAAMDLFIKSVFFDFYAILAVSMVLLFALGVIPEFGPMRKAERRALEEGKVLADGARPMMSSELAEMQPAEQIRTPRLFWNFFLPLALVVSIAVGSFILSGKAMILEAFMSAVLLLAVALWIQRVPLNGIVGVAVQGIKGVVPAMLLLALAYTLNTLSRELGTAMYVVELTRGWLTPGFLPTAVFLLCAIVSFSTGTSWGTYAIVIPIAVPLAFEFSGGEVDRLVLATVAAVAGGGVFGDHCSPLSDTTILSSFGAACDHMDHVRTQLPYALVAAGISVGLYILLGTI